MNQPSDLRYTDTHEWVRQDSDGLCTVGITDHAQSMLGDIIFVQLPELEIDIEVNDEVGVIESVKTAADIYSPLAGHIVAVNDQLTGAPDKVNQDPYGEGWLFRIKIENSDQLMCLLNASDYQKKVSES